MVKKGVLLLMLLFSCWRINSHAVQAKTYDYKPDQPIVMKNAGVHITLLNYQILTTPLPKFEYSDTDELERYLLATFEMSVVKNGRKWTTGRYDYHLEVGPNELSPIDEDIPKQLKKGTLLNTKSELTVKPGKHKRYTVLFVLYPITCKQSISRKSPAKMGCLPAKSHQMGGSKHAIFNSISAVTTA